MKIEFCDSKIQKIAARLIATTLITAMLAASSGNSVYAASDAWNDASSATTTGTTLDDGSVVYPNVYADPKEWSEWKTAWENIRTNYEQVALTPGNDATEINFAWYSHTVEKPAVRLTDSQGNPTGEIYYGNQGTTAMKITEDSLTTNLYPGKVTVNGLKEQTTYYYQYFLNGKWSDTYTYSTQSTDSFSILYVGDPQIGASKGQSPTEPNLFTNKSEYFARNDAYNWNQTLKRAVKDNKNLSFMISAGDHINQPSVNSATESLEQQIEFAGLLSSPVLRSIPIASTIGNHDSYSVNYKNHFNNPNSYTEEAGASVAGYDYYFSYGKALFVVLNTNNTNCQAHKALIDKAMAAFPDVKWKILLFHQDIYGSGAAHSTSDGIILTKQLTPIIDNAGFDVVLQGHDHTYSRTYQLSADENSSNIACYNTDTKNKAINPKGTVYFEANSSTGSKFYQLNSTEQSFIAARNQSWRPTYSIININEVSLSVKTYDAATHKELVADGGVETAYTIVKPIDKSNLEAKISEAEQQLINIGNDKQSADLKQVLESAKLILSDSEAGSADVDRTCVSVSEAMDLLTKKELDKTTSNKIIVITISILGIVSAGIVIGILIKNKKKK